MAYIVPMHIKPKSTYLLADLFSTTTAAKMVVVSVDKAFVRFLYITVNQFCEKSINASLLHNHEKVFPYIRVNS